MADNDTKRQVQILVLANVRANTDNDARTVGGTLARQIQASISDQYEVLGVELQGVSETNPKAPKAKDEPNNGPTTLKT